MREERENNDPTDVEETVIGNPNCYRLVFICREDAAAFMKSHRLDDESFLRADGRPPVVIVPFVSEEAYVLENATKLAAS